MKLTPRFLLKATLACLLLTITDLILERVSPLDLPTHRDFEQIAAWGVVTVGWIVYLLRK